ncbi:hypothetical protein Tco_1004453 [Tanacetum coccineum]|uniref:Uncharacterized protein n=1 Tax=Tanacetum coccineum TaxID=301880 RepID=A0ABQ5FC88_9ASTR
MSTSRSSHKVYVEEDCQPLSDVRCLELVLVTTKPMPVSQAENPPYPLDLGINIVIDTLLTMKLPSIKYTAREKCCFRMDDPNITMYHEDVHDLRSVETEFPAIVFNDNLTSNETLSYEPTVSSLNNNEIDFRISFDESDDEDYTVHSVSCIDDLDCFKDFENEFPAIVYNDALTSKLDFSTKPTLCPQHIDEFDLNDETSLSEYVEKEQNILYFNNLFPFNIIYPDDLKPDKDNDDNEIDMIQSSWGNENTRGSNNQLEGSHNKINKVFKIKSFIMELNVKIVAWNYFVNGMLFNLIKNLYVLFGIPFDPKWYYKDGNCARMLRRPRYVSFTLLKLGKIGLQERIRRIRLKPIRHMALPPRDQRHQYLRFREVVLDLDTAAEEMETVGFNAYWVKSGAMIFGGQYVACLAENFGLLTEERLQALTVIAWVPVGPARQEGDAGGVAEEAPVELGGGDEDEEMPQAMPPPPRTQGERISQLEEEVDGMH